MQQVTVTASNEANRLRVSIDGVQLMSLPSGANGQARKQLPARWHVLSWDALGNQDEEYEVTLVTSAGQQCHHKGVVGANGIDHGSCPFIVF